MDKDIAIKVEYLSKTFRIPHEKISSVRGAVVSAFKQKTYEEFQALDDVSFEVKKGEFFGIIGRNGSGKSTLLKILAGIYQPDKGRVQVNGMISPFLELGIGFNPELSGRDNVYLNATVLGMTRNQIDEKFDDIVAFSELERFIDQKLKNYSSGMQVRLAFAVSIHANRDILLMDEVLAVGDTNFQAKCIEEFNRFKRMGKTVLLVTHDTETVRRYCDRALLIRYGIIKKIGAPDEVVEKYLQENIFDEEKRMKSRNADKNTGQDREEEYTDDVGRKFDRGVADIVRINVLNEDGREKNVFRNGEKITVRLRVAFKKRVENPIFGIVLKESTGKPIFITNTSFRRMETGVFKNEEKDIEFILENVLASGTYSVSPAIADRYANTYFDWKNDMTQFVAVNEYISNGLVDLKHDIFIR